MNYGANGSASSVAPPLSPTLTVSYPSSSEAAQPGKSAVIDLEKQSHALNREEIVNVHYTDYGHDIQVQNRTSMTRWQQSLFRLRYARFKTRDFLAEFIGTLILILLVDGVAAEQCLNVVNKSWLIVALGNGLAVLFAICICGHVSGAHMNPAITVTFWLFKGFPSRKVPVYIAAQFLGAFSGAALLYLVIHPALHQFDGGTRSILGDYGTAGIFATYPPLYVGIGPAIASEVVGTGLLSLLVMVTGNPKNQPFCAIQGIVVASGITAILLALGYTSGFSLNPARDLGPRLFTAMAGWGIDVFRVANYYAVVPAFAPFLGAFLGGFTYTIFIDHSSISGMMQEPV